MTNKEAAIKMIQDMPDSVTWDDIKAGRGIPHEDVKASLSQWLSRNAKAVN